MTRESTPPSSEPPPPGSTEVPGALDTPAVVLERIADGIVSLDRSWRYTYLNEQAARMLGRPRERLLGRHIWTEFPDGVGQPFHLAYERAMATGETVVLREYYAPLDRWFENRIYASAEGITIYFSDVTEQAKAQEALAASERRLRTIIEHEPECVKVVSTEGTLLEMNPAGLAMLETGSVDEVQRAGLLAYLVPEHRAAFVALHRRVIAGESGTLEFEVVGLNGTRRWLETHAAPLADPDGGPPMLLGVTRDVTERKRAEEERRRLETQLRAAERMEAIGQLAGGIAHDFNNLLSVINNTAELAAEGLPDGSAMRDDLVEIRRAGERAAALTSQLLSLSRSQVFSPETVDVGELVDSLEPMLRRLVREDIALTVERPPEACLVSADRSQLERVLVNLAVNARDAMPRGGPLRVRVAGARIGDDGAALSPALGPGDYVELRVEDAGEGMPPETIAHVFEPFFTTKQHGRGTGLGLSSAYGTVVQSGGAFGVESAVGRGSTFRVLLPRVAERRQSPARGSARGAAVGGHETILVVDDEPTLVRVAMRLLEGAGYRTLGATSPAEALRLCAAMAGPLHLLLTDVVMPEMSGPELATAVCRRHPEARVVLASGYGEDARLRSAAAESAVVIEKPYTGASLLHRIRAVLDAERPA